MFVLLPSIRAVCVERQPGKEAACGPDPRQPLGSAEAGLLRGREGAGRGGAGLCLEGRGRALEGRGLPGPDTDPHPYAQPPALSL